MIKRPRYFNLMMAILLILPMSFFIQVAWIYELNPFTDFTSIVLKLTQINYLTMAVLLIGIPLYERASRLLLLWLPLSSFLVGYNNWVVSSYGADFQTWQTLAATTLYVGLGLFTLRRKHLKLILNPSLRWWLSSKRWPVSLPVKLKTKAGGVIDAQTFDISKTGAFIKTQENGVQLGDSVKIEIPSSSGPFVIEAKIIRLSPPQGHYPAGFGIKFSNLNLGAKLFLQQVNQNQMKHSS